MSEEHLWELQSNNLLSDPPKRKRTPSQFASHIADFKNNISLASKKYKNKNYQLNLTPREDAKCEESKPLKCTLSSGKSYTLKVVIDHTRAGKTNKYQKKKSIKLTKTESVQISQIKEQKQKPKQDNLLATFMVICEQLRKDQGPQSKEVNEQSCQNPENKTAYRQQRIRREKQKQQKWNKFCERSKQLNERLYKIQQNFIFLQ